MTPPARFLSSVKGMVQGKVGVSRLVWLAYTTTDEWVGRTHACMHGAGRRPIDWHARLASKFGSGESALVRYWMDPSELRLLNIAEACGLIGTQCRMHTHTHARAHQQARDDGTERDRSWQAMIGQARSCITAAPSLAFYFQSTTPTTVISLTHASPTSLTRLHPNSQAPCPPRAAPRSSGARPSSPRSASASWAC